MKKTCSNCGFFIPTDCCRDDLKEELSKINFAGVCGEITQQTICIPYVAVSELARCGKFMEPV